MRDIPVTECERGVGRIGAYRLERLLGRGGFGVVYAGVDTRLGRRAAIKQLLPELTRDREIVERFFNEAKAAAAIDHPGIVEIYDVGWHAETAYFAMKLLDGDSLGQRLATGPLDVVRACTIARQVSAALAAAHGRGIVHRDLKPDNIILVPDEEVAIGERAVILDFGIAKLSGSDLITNRTRTGMTMGTPTYMSPEQCRGSGDVDHRSDVYALGCILFEMLAGRPPFVAEAGGHVMGMHLFVEPPELAQLAPTIPPELAAVVMRALAKRPDDRLPDMAAVSAALRPFGTGGATERSMPRPNPPPTNPTRRRRAMVIAGTAAACMVAGLAIWKLGSGGDAQTDTAPSEGSSRPSVQTPTSDAPISSSPDAAQTEASTLDAPSGSAQTPPSSAPPPPKPARPGSPPFLADASQLVAQAREAQLRGDQATALARAELALAKQPWNSQARSIAAIAACSLGRLDATATHINALAGPARQAAQQACARKGVTIDVHSSQPGPPPLRPTRPLPPPPPPPPIDDGFDPDVP